MFYLLRTIPGGKKGVKMNFIFMRTVFYLHKTRLGQSKLILFFISAARKLENIDYFRVIYICKSKTKILTI